MTISSLDNKDINQNVRISMYFIAFYFLVLPLDFFTVLPNISIVKFTIFIPLFGCLFHFYNLKVRFNKYTIMLLIYLFVILISLLYSYNVSTSYNRALSIGSNILLILVLSMINYNYKEIQFFKKSIVYGSWFFLLLIFIFSNTTLNEGRLTIQIKASTQDPNYLVGYFIFTVIFYLYELLTLKRWINILYLSIFIFVILLTGSRGGFLSVLISIFCCIFLWIKNKKVKVSSLIFLSIIFVVFCIVIYFIIDYIPDAIISRYHISYTITDGGANRFNIWSSMLYNYKQFPALNKLFGQGVGTIRSFTINGNVGHNLWLETLIELGMIGVIIICLLYLIFLIKIYNLKDNVIIATFIGYIALTMSLSLYSYKPIWNIFFLILITVNYRNRTKHIENMHL